jgi:ATP-dependent RNA helicase DDX56/DBP9
VQEFNKGVYDYIIATDENGAHAEADSDDEPDEDGLQDGVDECRLHLFRAWMTFYGFSVTPTQRAETNPDEDTVLEPTSKKRKHPQNTPQLCPSQPKKHKRRTKSDREYGVTRGVDFIDVACVLNFDLPTSSRSYTHRVGRTARAGRAGMSLSYVVPQDKWGKNKVVGGLESAKNDEAVFARIEKEQAARGSKIQEYKFDMKQVEAFRYRMDDALRSVTRSAIKEARIKELKTEIINSEKLKVGTLIHFLLRCQCTAQAHFEDNPLDLEYLRHDKPLHPTRVQAHMKHIPKYLLPRLVSAPAIEAEESQVGFVPFKKSSTRSRGRGRTRGSRGSGSGGRGGKKKSDPLKKFR